MVIFRELGKMANTVVGGTAKSGVKLVSKAISIKNEKVGNYIDELGNSVIDASKAAVDSASQFADGAVRTGYGAWKKNEGMKQQGWNDIKDSSGRTIRGIGSSVKDTFHNGKTVVTGIRTNDKDQLVSGLKNLGKVAAVTTFAVGVIDIVDGPDFAGAEGIETRNDHFLGMEHPETGVQFEMKAVELPRGDVVEGTFPVFESKFSVVLTEEVYLNSDSFHFSVANETLYESIRQNPQLANELGLTSEEIEGLTRNITPEGYVWHHSEEPGILQLVDEEIHHNTGHTGGRELWGGGADHR
ncbi:HNH endonuclease [Rossellomorea aquimaris]|uniref:Colicin-lik bacteriocin with DNase/tRNase domain n=1 Tax=Rossellomorea aquimaris TaxID=189382 RepID=A0A366EJI4_9BACI|nr:HNH endonuclease [Rossellomorea aquimaris]RBP02518.1 colicin-lik bacteriocin with DNase/tRNase domain [Rossellomorea aquimaris]